MKKKLLILLLTVVAALCCALCLAACDDKPAANSGNGGTQTEQGGNGGNQSEHTHTYGDYVGITPATCSATGLKGHYQCETCGEYFNMFKQPVNYYDLVIKIDPNAHELGEWVDEVPATCSTTGTKGYQQCDYCHNKFDINGKQIDDLTIDINPSAHKFGGWTPDVPATCSTTGTKGYQQCDYCHNKFDTNGKQIDDLTIDVNPSAHKWNVGVTTKEPTCTEQGTKLFTCVHNENHTKTEQIEIDTTKHDMRGVPEKSPTCTEDGYTAYQQCSRCGYKDGYVKLVASGHQFNEAVSKKTCLQKKAYINYACTKCTHQEQKEIEDISATFRAEDKHYANGVLQEITVYAFAEGGYGDLEYKKEAFKTSEDKKPLHVLEFSNANGIILTDKNIGLSEYIIQFTIKDKYGNCTVYKFSVGDNKVISTEIPEAHEWNEGVQTLAPTCTTQGTMEYTCVYDEGHKKTELIAIDENAHTYGPLIQEKQPTCTDTGIQAHYHCACGKYFDEEYQETTFRNLEIAIDPDAHNFNGGENCTICNVASNYTRGLEYVYTSYLKGYVVSGIGTATDETEIVIPCSYMGEPVTSIATNAFGTRPNLKAITIPDSVTNIGGNAFSGCTNIKTATIPAMAISYIPKNNLQVVIITSGTSLGNYAFQNCTSLTNITIPDSVTSIGDSAFDGCTSLTNITIPDSVISIGSRAFYSCTSLESVNFGNDNKLESIGSYAFYECTSLTSITIPDSIVSINDGVFSNCASLKTINIPDSIVFIGGAFFGCKGLVKVYITDIKSWCNIEFDSYNSNPLYYAHNLYLNDNLVNEITVDMLQGVTEIKDYAFYECTSLTSITIPDGVISIGKYAFQECSNLSETTIPDSVTSIGYWAFSQCYKLFKTENNVKYVDKWVVECDEYSSAIAASIKSGTKGIADYAFEDCTKLESVTIPESVIYIGQFAFKNCPSLKGVTIEGDAKNWQMSKTSDMADATPVDLSNAIGNVEYFTFDYVEYYWKRDDANE